MLLKLRVAVVVESSEACARRLMMVCRTVFHMKSFPVNVSIAVISSSQYDSDLSSGLNQVCIVCPFTDDCVSGKILHLF